jgi:uncharacterized membrane protein YgdD (TMEM256/DUF423 family)
MQRVWIGFGALVGLSTVAMAAIAAHGLTALEPAALQSVHSAVEMQGWHALALLACGLWAPRGGALADWAGAAFSLGIVLFCGGVYAVALFDVRLGMMAPAGGVLLMLGWVMLAISAVITTRRP